MGYFDKLEWVDEAHPEILRVPITLESRQHRNLGLDGEVPNFQTFQYIDMSKLTSLRHCFLTEDETPDEDTCLIYTGAESDGLMVDVPLSDMMKMWLKHKKWKNEQR